MTFLSWKDYKVSLTGAKEKEVDRRNSVGLPLAHKHIQVLSHASTSLTAIIHPSRPSLTSSGQALSTVHLRPYLTQTLGLSSVVTPFPS